MKHSSFITLPYLLENQSPAFEDDALRFPESLVRYTLKTYTKKGDKVFDPFIGLGTTAFIAEETGRIPYGIEAERNKFEWGAGQLEHWQNIIHGDSANIAKFNLPKMDFCITSPPFMAKDHKWNPLFSGNPKKAGYDVYLRRMKFIFGKIAAQMKKNAYVIVQADDIDGKTYTPLIRDLSNAIESPALRLDGQTIIKWEQPHEGYSHTTCLIFKRI